MSGEAAHAGTVAEDRAARDGAGGIDREDGDAMALLAEEEAELLDEGGFAGTGDTGDADAGRAASVRDEDVDQGVGGHTMTRERGLNEGDGAGEGGAISSANACREIIGRRRSSWWRKGGTCFVRRRCGRIGGSVGSRFRSSDAHAEERGSD